MANNNTNTPNNNTDNNIDFQVCSLNVNGLGSTTKTRLLSAQMDLFPFVSIFALQETHAASYINNNRFQSFISPGTGRSCGCIILVSHQFLVDNSLSVQGFQHDGQGRLAVLSLVSQVDSNFVLKIFSVYAPNNPSERRDFFTNSLAAHLDLTSKHIILGDFNCVMNLSDTTSRSAHISALQGRAEITDLCNTFELNEGDFDSTNPGVRYTWHHQNEQMASRLDRVYKPISWPATYYHRRCAFSDHSMVFCSLSSGSLLSSITKHNTFWKINNSILTHSTYLGAINQLFSDTQTLRPLFDSACSYWDHLKGRIKNVTKSYCRRVAKQRRADIDRLEQELKFLRSLPNPITPTISQDIQQLKEQLDHIQKERLEGLFVRSRLEREFFDEKCTRFFFDRIRQRKSRSNITAIRGLDNSIYTNQVEIEGLLVDYYKQLYDVSPELDNEVSDEFLSELPTVLGASETFLSQPDKDSLREVLYRMKNNKTPGPDGLSVEFFKTFFDACAPLLLDVYSEIMDGGAAPASMSQSVFVLLKKEGDQLDMSNKRPISLLNVDYKLFASFLNEKYLSRHLDKVVSPEQLCGVRGRSIQDGLCLMRDVIDYYSDRFSIFYAVSLDQRKAFDMVDRNFLFRSLRKLGFDEKFISVLRTLYSNTTAQIQVNGNLTDVFQLKRGMRQGCPLSPLLYTIYIESLVLTFKRELSGVPVCGTQVFISAYADDILIFCHEGEIHKVFTLCDQFKRATGSQVNVHKTRILCFPGSDAPPEYKTAELKYLGVVYSFLGHKQVVKLNYSILSEKVKKKIGYLSRLSITLKGKVLVVNALLAPIYYHIASVYLPKPDDIKKLERCFFSFLWGEGKREVLARSVVKTTLENGGLGLVRIEERLRSFYVYANLTRLVEGILPQDSPRHSIFRYNFSDRVRRLYPDVFSLKEPHRLRLTEAYNLLYSLFVMLRDKLEHLAPSVPSLSALMQFFSKEEKTLSLVHPPGPWSEGVTKAVYSILCYGQVFTHVSDFLWRSVRGGLKTGEFISRYKIPGLVTTCVFCKAETESVCHLFLFCKVLKPVRERLLLLVENVAGRSTPERDILFLITGLSPVRVNKPTEIFFVNVTGSVNRAIWFRRNDMIFGQQQLSDIQGLLFAVESIISRIKDKFLPDNNG